MKKLLNLFAAAALTATVLFAVAKPTPASAASVAGPSIGTICHVAAPLFSVSQGTCASFIATLGPAICRFEIAGVEIWELAGAKNRGECTSTVQQFVRDLIKSLP